MPSTCRVFIATSLDGFIARDDGSIDWLDAANAVVPPGEDMGYAEFMSTVDALVMGRHTFEMAMSFDPWPYSATPVVVLSSQLPSLPGTAPATVSLHRGGPATLVADLASQGLNHLYVDGGRTIQGFLALHLIDELTITTIPVLLGSGKPLFGASPADVRLQHVATRAYEFGFVQTTWRVQR
jgi:dihydrofolate reductase